MKHSFSEIRNFYTSQKCILCGEVRVTDHGTVRIGGSIRVHSRCEGCGWSPHGEDKLTLKVILMTEDDAERASEQCEGPL